MTVLGSREQYCVNNDAKSCNTGVSEGCIALMSGKNINSNGNIEDKKGSGTCNCTFRNELANKVSKEEPSDEKTQKRLPDHITYETFLKGLGIDKSLS